MRQVNLIKLILALITVVSLSMSATAQEAAAAATEEKESIASVDAGFDLYTSYVWRGSKFGTGPALQPWVEGAIGGLAIGAWGSVNAGSEEAFEMDLYLSYSFEFGLGITITDYYFGSSDSTGAMVYGDFFAYDATHTIEPSLSYEIGDFSVLAAYAFDPGFEDGAMYYEVGYSFGALSLAVGAGDSYYTSDGDFMLCNVTVGASKDIEITEKFTLPLSGSVTLNPSTEGFFISAGVSF